MSYSNSSLVSYTNLTKHHSGLRTHSIDRITPHCVVGQWTAKKIADYFATTNKDASCNYGIGTNGDISLSVEEKNRSWCSSSNANDQRAITIECASEAYAPYEMSDEVYESLIKLCTDICKRNSKNKLIWISDKNTALNYNPASNEMLLTVHRWFANKSCPGDWLYSRLGELTTRVNVNLTQSTGNTSTSSDSLYRVQVGAYKNKANADAMLEKVKAAGFSTYMVQVDGLYKIQVGAYKEKENAEAMASKVKAAGFDCFISGSSSTSTVQSKSVDELANEVIKGLWGNGADRKNRLTEAGYDYSAVQNKVNELLQ